MFFPSNLIVAIIIAFIYIFISFKIELPKKQKKFFRVYSIVVQSLFCIFLLIFTWLTNPTFNNNGLYMFLDGLVIFYYLMTVPLLIVLIYFISKWILKLDDFSFVLRSIVVLIISATLIGINCIGYYAFVITFYGIAP